MCLTAYTPNRSPMPKWENAVRSSTHPLVGGFSAPFQEFSAIFRQTKKNSPSRKPPFFPGLPRDLLAYLGTFHYQTRVVPEIPQIPAYLFSSAHFDPELASFLAGRNSRAPLP